MSLKIGQSSGASWWRICFERGLPRLVFPISKQNNCFIWHKKLVYNKKDILVCHCLRAHNRGNCVLSL